ncbi:MAG: hypothetical protein ACE366_30710 [Bradymonadia bacterium]
MYRWMMLTLATLTLYQIGCSAPATAIRRTLVAPAPAAPSQLGAPLKPGEVRLQGGIATESQQDMVFPEGAEEGDPGTLTPTFQMQGSLAVGVTDYLEIAGRTTYGTYESARANVAGVQDIPAADRAGVARLGGSMRLHLTPKRGAVNISLGLGMDLSTVQQGVFLCDDCPNTSDLALASSEDPRYRLVDKQVSRVLLQDAHLQLGGWVNDWLYIFGYGGVQSALLNVGFESDRTTLHDDTLDAVAKPYLGAGLEGHIGQAVFTWSVMMPYPAHDAAPEGVWSVLRVGLAFGGD